MANPLFAPLVREALKDDDRESLASLSESLHPATVAEILDDDFDADQILRVLDATTIANQATLFEYLPLERQIELVEKGRPQMARLIEEMSSDDRAQLLRSLDPKVRENLLRLVDEADRRDIARLVQFPEGSAGALMTTEYAWLPENIKADEAMDRLRLQAPDAETIYVIYIVDEQRRLQGVVSLRELLLAQRQTPVAKLMSHEVVRVKATDDVETVAQELTQYDLIAVPVVDGDDRLVGIITHDDILDVVVEEATEDAHRMGAVGPIDENYLEAGFFKVWWNRAFWLSLLFLTGMLTFWALEYFEGSMKSLPVLMFFVPLCISTGGNSGSQAATLITRAMALGQVGVKDWRRVLRHELLMGLALGVTLGVLGWLRTYWLTGGVGPEYLPRLALVIGIAATAICLYGTLIGSMLPLVFKRLGVDPGVASGPFVATFVDVTGILIYFSVARLVLFDALA